MCINCMKKKARSLQGEWDKDKYRKDEKRGDEKCVYISIGISIQSTKYACAT